MKVVLVGEAWGRREAAMKHALVGPSGRELTLELGISGLAPYLSLRCRKCHQTTDYIDNFCQHCRDYVWPNEFDLVDHWKRLRQLGLAVTNVFAEQPPNNDLGFFFDRERTTNSVGLPRINIPASNVRGHPRPEHEHHIRRLFDELETLNPNLVVLMGNSACWAVLGQTKISALRGTVSTSQIPGAAKQFKTLPVYHPAAILRQPSMRPTNLADLKKATIEAEFADIRRPERWITITDPDEAGIRLGYEWFRRPATAYANDIETSRGQITIVGFARSPSDALVIPFRNEDDRERPNYWPTEGLEFAAWKLVQYGLQTPVPKIFQNGLYDLSYFLKMGLHVKNVAHDCMLWHHSLYPELPKSLGFLGSIYANDVAWKLMRHNTSLKRDE